MKPDAVNAMGEAVNSIMSDKNNDKVYILRKEDRKKAESLISQLAREDIFFKCKQQNYFNKDHRAPTMHRILKERADCV